MVVLGIFSSCQDVSLFMVVFFAGTTKNGLAFWQCFWSFVRASGHFVLWFCFFSVALRFERTMAFLVCSYLFVLTLRFLFVCCLFGGTIKGGSVFPACCVPWCFVFVCSFLAGGCALVVLFISASCHIVSFLLCFGSKHNGRSVFPALF